MTLVDKAELTAALAERDAARAEGWDEGWDERDGHCSEPYSPPKVNPYRAALAATEDQP